MERNRGGRPRHPDVLTPAEWRVLEALRGGGTNAEIGARLGISADAVKYHVSNMLGKLELRDRRALAVWRPEERRGRLRAWFAVPAALAAIARPVAWVGIGTAAAAGVTVAVVAAVVAVAVVLVGVPGDGQPPSVALPPLVTPEATSTPAPTPTAAPSQSPTRTATPASEPCDSIECIRVNPCRGPECMEADPDRASCDGYDRIEAVPNAFEHRTFEHGERIDWSDGVFFLDVETGRTEAYRVAGANRVAHWFQPGARWVVAKGYDGWGAVLHRESGQAWRFPDGREDVLAELLREDLDLEFPVCVQYPEPRPALGQPGYWGVLCEEADSARSAPGESSCRGRPSPDGRYVAQQWGQPASIKYYTGALVHVDPSVVITDAETCAPLFRIRPAYAYQVSWEAQWLANSEGFVVGTQDGYAILRVVDPEIVQLPGAGHGPIPAPTGDGRYFLNDYVGVYDSHADRWVYTGFRDSLPEWIFEWGETEHEVRYAIVPPEGAGGYVWNLSPPTIEYPPFEEVAFRVAGTGACLDIRMGPSAEATVLGCITEGARVTLVVPPKATMSCPWDARCSLTALPTTSTETVADDQTLTWVYVRTPSGVQGWVTYAQGSSPVHLHRIYLEALE
ncbi:MAG: helix-turn-helix transcriptional regulator [Gemmatimonadetes bacterium]|nr:helix-turn-helix transcriptional regulator [Gemmatimonadota bacterium]